MVNQSKKIIAFYLITFIGSNIAMLGTFLLLAKIFDSIHVLTLGLGLKTGVQFFSNLFVPTVFKKFLFKKTLFYSEILGLISIIFLLIGVETQSMWLVLISISALAIPSNFLHQGIIAQLKIQSNSSEEFSKVTGLINKVLGAIDLVVCLIVPFLIKFISIKELLLFDIVTYLCGLIVLLTVSPVNEVHNKKVKFNNIYKFLKYIPQKENIKWHFKLSGAMLLVGFVPVVAGDTDISNLISAEFVEVIPYLWFVEGLALLISGFVDEDLYYKLNLNHIGCLSGSFILCFLLLPGIATFFISVFIFNLIYMVMFRIKRDQFINRSEGDTYLKVGFISFSKSISFTISPFILSFLFAKTGFLNSFLVLISFQIILYMAFSLSNNSEKKETNTYRRSYV